MHDNLNEVKSSVLLAELELHKTEYTTVRQEIIEWHDAVKKYHDLCLLSIAAGFGITPIIIQYRIQAILLLLPLLFYLIILRIEYSFSAIRKFTAYLVDVLTPRVNSILDQLGADRQGIKALGWQDYWNQQPKHYSIEALAIPSLAIFASIGVYLFITLSQTNWPPIIEIILFTFNIILLVRLVIKLSHKILKKMRQESSSRSKAIKAGDEYKV